jgi:hypothetical protein
VSKDIITAEVVTPMLDRANEVRARISQIKEETENNFLDLCELLLEAQEGSYHTLYGYGRFADWVEQDSGLDMSARQAFYLVNIAKKVKQLGLSRQEIKQAKVSKLKEIFSLEPTEHAEEMKQLVAAAESDSLDEVKEKVAKLKAKQGEEPKAYMTLKVDASVKETIEEAIELARMNYGDVVVNGEVTEASVSQCMELIAIAYLQDANNRPENNIESEAREIETE